MNKIVHLALYLLLVVGMSSDVLSRSSSRSSSGSSFRSSPSRSSSTSSSSSKPTYNVPSRSSSSGSTFKSSTPSPQKPKAVSENRIEKQKIKAMASQNKTAAATYGSKSKAEQAFREKMAASNSYNTSTPPAVRPATVPQSVTINNTSINTSYDRLPNGGYAYGYTDPTTHLFIALAASQMMVNSSVMAESGYGHWRDDGRPYNDSPMNPVVIVVLVLLGAGVIIGIIILGTRGSN